jgi:hypothetical protein
MLLALVVAVGGYLIVYRPFQLRWGATREEVGRHMPGDELQTNPIFNATRAVTIDAAPQTVWPWLMQIGYRRAGWYGYDWVDNDGIRSARRILPEWQTLKAGDVVPIWRGMNFPVRAIETNRYLVFTSADDANTMAVELLPAGPGRTRLVWRVRLAAYNWKSPFIVLQLFTDATDFIAVRQNLLGIKARAEGKEPESAIRSHGALGLWLLSFVLFLAAEIGLVVHGDAWGALLAAMATGLITVFLVLGNLPIWVDLLGMLVGVLTLRLAFYRRNHKPERVSRDRTSAIAELRHSEARQNERTD